MPLDARIEETGYAISDCGNFATLAQYVASQMLGHERDGPSVQIFTWEADLLLFTVQQAKNAAVHAEQRWLVAEKWLAT